MKTKICEVCGKEFETNAWNARYCSRPCLREANRRNSKRRKQSEARMDLKVERIRYTTADVAEIAKRASELGMSYGEYVGRFKI